MKTLGFCAYFLGVLGQIFLHLKNKNTLEGHGFAVSSSMKDWNPVWLAVFGGLGFWLEKGFLPPLGHIWHLPLGLVLLLLGIFIRVYAQSKLGHGWVMGKIFPLPEGPWPLKNVENFGRSLELLGLFVFAGVPGTAIFIFTLCVLLMQKDWKNNRTVEQT